MRRASVLRLVLSRALIVLALFLVAVPVPARAATCTRVLGMSQTRNWYEQGAFESSPGIDPSDWELGYVAGTDVDAWAQPGFIGYSPLANSSPSCGSAPTRVVFTVTDDDSAVVAPLQQVLRNIRATWPSVTRIDLVPAVGGPNHGLCSITTPQGLQSVVASTRIHAAMDAAIAAVVGGDVFAGPDLLAGDCSHFRDATGHLSAVGSVFVAGQVAEFYSVPTLVLDSGGTRLVCPDGSTPTVATTSPLTVVC